MVETVRRSESADASQDSQNASGELSYVSAGVETGVGIRAGFRWLGDRYGHSVDAFVDGQWRTVMLSVEGDDRSNWPPSPPFQQLLIEHRATGPVGLLVGMAGKSHWSGSVEFLTDPVRLAFDIACLARQQPARLESSYELQQAIPQIRNGQVIIPDTSVPLTISADSPETSCTIAGSAFRISPACTTPAAATASYRWKYCIST